MADKTMTMRAVVTGDIIGSTKVDPQMWLPTLKQVLNRWGTEPGGWETYRGDSFQLILNSAEQVWEVMIWLKAGIRAMQGLDVRLGIGIGPVTFQSGRVTQSNGDAFIRSGQIFDALAKMDQNVAIKTPWEDFDQEVNLGLKLLTTIISDWTSISCQAILTKLEHPRKSQMELGTLLGITQHAVSARLTRAKFDMVMEWVRYYERRLEQKK